jgi:hypothetical protein
VPEAGFSLCGSCADRPTSWRRPASGRLRAPGHRAVPAGPAAGPGGLAGAVPRGHGTGVRRLAARARTPHTRAARGTARDAARSAVHLDGVTFPRYPERQGPLPVRSAGGGVWRHRPGTKRGRCSVRISQPPRRTVTARATVPSATACCGSRWTVPRGRPPRLPRLPRPLRSLRPLRLFRSLSPLRVLSPSGLRRTRPGTTASPARET